MAADRLVCFNHFVSNGIVTASVTSDLSQNYQLSERM